MPKTVSPDQGVGDSLAHNPHLDAELQQIKDKLKATEVQLERERKALNSLRSKVNVDESWQAFTKTRMCHSSS
jgi:hypothetical protein